MKPAHSFDELYRHIRLRKVPFLVTFFVVVFVTYLILFLVDFIPQVPADAEVPTQQVTASTEKQTAMKSNSANVAHAAAPEKKKQTIVTVDPLPTRIIIDKLDTDIQILNPKEATIAAMDTALLQGVVRHPDSADFKKVGNIFLLGHSSYLPNVFNKNFQAFNGIQKLTWGDKIRLQSEGVEYIYRVDTVRKEKATNAVVPYTWGTPKLTLVTCNSFASKEDRFVVVATLVGTRAL